MANPFSMLSMLTKARRQTARRTESTTSITSETSTGTLATPSSTSTTAASAAATLISSSPPRRDSSPPQTLSRKASIASIAAKKDTSDTASIRSVQRDGSTGGSGTLRKATLLSRFSSGAIETLTSAISSTPTAASTSTPGDTRPSTPSSPPPPIAPPPATIAESVGSATPPTVLSDSPRMLHSDWKSLASDEGFVEGDAGKDSGRRESNVSSEETKKSLETALAENALDKQKIKRLEEEKGTLEKDKASLVEELGGLKKDNEGLMGEKANLEKENEVLVEQKDALVKEKDALVEQKTALEKEKTALVEESARITREMKDKELRWEDERRSSSDALSVLEARNADLVRELNERQAKWDIERRNLEATFTGEKEWFENEMKQMAIEWQLERDTDKKQRDEELALVERDNDSLTKRVVELDDALEEMKKAKAELTVTVDGLQQEKVETIAVIDSLNVQISMAMEDIERMQHDEEVQKKREEGLLEELGHLQAEKDAEIAARDDRIASLSVSLKQARTQHEDLRELSERKLFEKEGAIEELKDQMAAYYQYVDQTDRRNRILCDQLKRQSMEVRLATPAESRKLLRTSGEPIETAVRLLNHFNSEAFQAAASFADSVEAETFLDFSGLADLEPLAIKLAPAMGREMVLALRASYTNTIQEPDTFLLQIAFQACVTHCANRFINSWYPFEWEQSDFLQILHGRILDTGTILQNRGEPLREYVYDLLAVVGRSGTQPAVEALVKSYEDKLSLLARLAIRLHILFAEDVSGDLASYAASPESDFVHDCLEDNYGEGGQSDDDFLSDNRVLCTTELGLQKMASGNDHRLVLLKPKVALSSVLNADSW